MVDIEASATDVEAGPRARTRRAILDAAVTVFSGNGAASLGDVAQAAGVGRTTIHRYYPERSDLLVGLGRDMLEKMDAAASRARIEEGTPLDAIRRLVQEYFELGDGLMLIFDIPHFMEGPEWEGESEFDRALIRTVQRGIDDGSIDPRMTPEWTTQVLWTLLYGAWQHVRDNGVTKHHALDLCLRTMDKALRA